MRSLMEALVQYNQRAEASGENTGEVAQVPDVDPIVPPPP